MTLNEPFLLLHSPSVATLGEANVIADTVNQPFPGFADLEKQCDFLIKLARLNDGAVCLAVERQVKQWLTSRRDANEWLVCSSLPENPHDAERILSAMRQLWPMVYHTEDEETADWLKKAEQKMGTYFQACRMTEITKAFQSHPDIKGISWRPIAPPIVPPSPSVPPPRRYIMRTLIVIIGLVTLGVLVMPHKNDPKGPGPDKPGSQTETSDGKTWKEWHGVLSGDEDRWKKLMDATGGIEAYKSWEVAKKLIQQEADQTGGLKGLFKDSQPEEPDEKKQQAVKKLAEWMERYCREFNLAITKPQALNDDPMTRYLKKAEQPWHSNRDDQIDKATELPFLKSAGEKLDDFISIFGEPKPEQKDLSNRISVIWKALDAFSKSDVSDDIKPFHDVVKQKLQDLNPPPDNYSILTLKDAERVTQLRNVFGCEEFGLVFAGNRYLKLDRWDSIKNSLRNAITQTESKNDSVRTLQVKIKSAFLELGPENPASSESR